MELFVGSTYLPPMAMAEMVIFLSNLPHTATINLETGVAG